MAAETFVSRDGIYLVDWAMVTRIARSYARANATLKYTRVNEESHWIGPTLHTIDVDWDAVHRQTDFDCDNMLAKLYQDAKGSMESQINVLEMWTQETGIKNSKFQDLMRDAQHKSMENLNTSVNRLDNTVTALKITRDFSAEFLMVGATALTGGAAGAVLAVSVGAGLKTAARADDEKASKGALAATFASEFVLGCLDLKVGKLIEKAAERAGKHALLTAVGGPAVAKLAEKAAQHGSKFALAILWTHAKGFVGEPVKAIVQGKNFANSMVIGGLKTAGSIHSEIIKHIIEDSFPKAALLADTAISYGMDKLADFATERKETTEPREQKGPPRLRLYTTLDNRLLDSIRHAPGSVQNYAVRKIGSMSSPR